MNILTATMRSKKDLLGVIRSNGMIPAVVYGAGVETTSISVPAINFGKVLKIAGESSTIVLELSGDTKGPVKKIDVLIHEVQVHPVKGFPIHIDFLAVDMNKPVEVAVPLEFIGIAPAEKEGLGSLMKILHEIEVEALPKDLPHNIEVDISSLVTLANQIHVRDIVVPKGVKIITDGEEVVALVAPAKTEKAEEEAPVDLSAIEVEKKGKKDEEGAEASKEEGNSPAK